MVAKNRLKNAGKALSLNENDPRVLNDLGWTLVLAGSYDEARTALVTRRVHRPGGVRVAAEQPEGVGETGTPPACERKGTVMTMRNPA